MSSRCVNSKPFGSPVLDGGQAEYVRVPMADASLVHAPEKIDETKLLFMADTFPTGYFAASNAFQGLPEASILQQHSVTFWLRSCGSLCTGQCIGIPTKASDCH